MNNLGYFSKYDIEFVYDFIGNDKILKKLEELKLQPSFGMSFNQFVNDNSYSESYEVRGSLDAFCLILVYFNNDYELAHFLYQKSKNLNFVNYYESKNLSEKWRQANNSYKKSLEFKHLNFLPPINRYWIEYHFFTIAIVEVFMESRMRQKLLNSTLDGVYKKCEKDYINDEGTVIRIKKRRKPNVGNFLFLEKIENFECDLDNISLDILEGLENLFQFQIVNRFFSLQMFDEFISIKEIKRGEDKKISEIMEYNFDDSLNTIFHDYIRNFSAISDSIYENLGGGIANPLVWYAEKFKGNNSQLHSQLVELVQKYAIVWS